MPRRKPPTGTASLPDGAESLLFACAEAGSRPSCSACQWLAPWKTVGNKPLFITGDRKESSPMLRAGRCCAGSNYSRQTKRKQDAKRRDTGRTIPGRNMPPGAECSKTTPARARFSPVESYGATPGGSLPSAAGRRTIARGFRNTLSITVECDPPKTACQANPARITPSLVSNWMRVAPASPGIP